MIEDASADPTFSRTLEIALLADIRSLSVQGVNDTIELAVQDADGVLLAGFVGTTSYGWLRVNMLWIAVDQRRTGIGKDLMERATELSRARECHSVWLETSNPAACAFYKKLGFVLFATLENDGLCPRGHRRWFLRRRIEASNATKTAL